MSTHEDGESKENRARIAAVAKREGLVSRIVPLLGKKLLLLDLPSAQPFPQDRLEGYIAHHIHASRRSIHGRCFYIALAAKQMKRAKGIMQADDLSQESIFWREHTINFDVLPDKTVAGVDLIASDTLDGNQGNLDVLVVRAANPRQLCARIGQIYSGTWQIIQ